MRRDYVGSRSASRNDTVRSSAVGQMLSPGVHSAANIRLTASKAETAITLCHEVKQNWILTDSARGQVV